MENTVPHPKIESADAWLAERLQLLKLEKELTRQKDAVAAFRRRLPMVKIEKTYVLEGPDGNVNFFELFAGKRQLIVYHFMFDPTWDEGCGGCTGFIDAQGDMSLLGERDTRFIVVSRAPLDKLEAYKLKKGWDIDWYSSLTSDFNYDYHVTADASVAPPEYNYKSEAEWQAVDGKEFRLRGEQHGLSVFFRIGEDVYHTYSTYGRGVDTLTDAYALLEVTPYGRQEDWEDSPEGWPQKPTYG